ncbi:ferric reductase-like transmembrane domain-containing protein [Streptomyces sp. NPDC047123]|uniref:ferredoxin reductase family protein n=1 Tax=Streptomyces sp. NPDC047123 TaxID=3155622 RepID=UPI00340FCAE6
MTTEAADPRLDAYPALSAYLRQTDPAARAPTGPTARTPDAPVPPVPAEPPRVPAPPDGHPRRGTGARRPARPARGATPVPPVRVSPRALHGGVLGGALAVGALWAVQAEPSARLDVLFATGAHLTGLLAGYGILVMLFLMARVPAVEHGVGADLLARRHALGGRYVLTLCAAHALLALCGYAAHADTDLLHAGLDLLGYPGLAAATAGTALLAAVGVTSARTLRRRVPHETWRAVHLLTYLGAALAFVHQLAGPDVAGGLPSLWLWSLLHAIVAVLLVWYRLVVPVRQALRHSLRVTGVRDEGPGVVSVVVQGIGVADLRAEPGQFFRWRFLQRRLWHTALPFSLSAPVRDDTLRITVKAAGDHTRRMRRLRPGTRVLATGPFGALTAHRRTRRKVLLLAGGVGITPMRALFETLPGGPGDVTLLYRAGSADQLVLREELEAIAERRQAGLHYLLGRSDAAFDPLAPQALRNLIPDLAEHDVYLCGPPGMSAAAEAALVRAGVPAERIHAECFTF